jgi:multidrug efflux pump subunit AcrB
MNKLKQPSTKIEEEVDPIEAEILRQRSCSEMEPMTLEEELQRRKEEAQKQEEELKDSEQLMNKIVKSFLKKADESHLKFNKDLDKINSLDLKLVQIQKKLSQVLSENAFYSKELRRLKVD